MIVERLERALGSDAVLTDVEARSSRRRDRWALTFLRERASLPTLPCCIVCPKTRDDVVTTVNLCRESATPLVPYGLGSGVCGGIAPTAESVVLDMGNLSRIGPINTHDQTARFEAGVRGSDAERAVAAHGLSLGHFPQSIELSTVGGWVATRAAGQFSTAYGSIEDRVMCLDAVLPGGDVLSTRATPRSSTGPDLTQLLLGSEGTLGVITGVTLKLERQPTSRELAAFYLPSMERGFELQRRILQAGVRPAVLRQYDPPEVARLFSSHQRNDDCLLLAIAEGEPRMAAAELACLNDFAAQCGADPAPVAAVEDWLRERNHVPNTEKLMAQGLVVDTIEVASTWERIDSMYRGVVAALSAVDGIWNGSAHSSHVYASGINLYFTFAAQGKTPEEQIAKYQECWQAVMQATLAAGGGISHHHGIGRVRRQWLEREIGSAGVNALRAIKRALDPAGFMNPGALIPD